MAMFWNPKTYLDTPTEILSSEYGKFMDFLLNFNIISIGIGFIVSQNLNIVFNDLMKGVISPIITKLIGSEKKNLEEVKLVVFGIDLYIWKFLFSIINFYLILIILFYLSKFLPIKPKSK
jgi:large-conductance mechanosensitive channel